MHDSREVLTRPAPPPDLSLRYGPEAHHVVDVRFSEHSGPAPLIVFIHGGFWRADYDRAHTGPLASALAKAGFAVCVPEYRRSSGSASGWPATFDDLAMFTDGFVELLRTDAGEDRFDFSRVVLAGHSAGGQLALWAAGRHRLPPGVPWRRECPLPIRGVLALAAVTDLSLGSALALDDGAVDLFLGGSPAEVPERYEVASPIGLIPLGLPVVLVHGTKDDRVPPAMSTSYFHAADIGGDPVQLRELPGEDHFAVIDPLSSAWPQVLAAADALIGR